MFEVAEAYEAMMGRWSRQLAPRFIDFVRVRDADSVLDVGCGTGSLAATLAKVTKASKIVGIDPSNGFIAYARAQNSDPRLVFDVGDAQQLPHPDASFDRCLALLAVDHIPDARKAARQERFRLSLPDALDVMVICLDAGQSLAEAIRQTSTELATAHPELAREFNMVQHEMLLGLSAGEALRKFGQRSDLEEVRTLATVLLQAEKFGASVGKTLRVQADQLRWRRQQRAEEKAQRAAVLHGQEPLLVVAGAGSGKTGTLAHRVAHLVVEGTDPRRILLLTFSRRAAAEMVRRIERPAQVRSTEMRDACACLPALVSASWQMR